MASVKPANLFLIDRHSYASIFTLITVGKHVYPLPFLSVAHLLYGMIRGDAEVLLGCVSRHESARNVHDSQRPVGLD